jgi:hypothetical protein
MWNVYAALKMYLFGTQRYPDYMPLATPAGLQAPANNVSPETWKALRWMQIFHLQKLINDTGFALDEAARGIDRMLLHKEVPIWLTFALKMQFDIEDVLPSENTLAASFRNTKQLFANTAQTSRRAIAMIDRLRKSQGRLKWDHKYKKCATF